LNRIAIYTAYRQFRAAAGNDDDLWPAIHLSKDPAVFAILFEDGAAILGLLVAFLGLFFGSLLHKPSLDGVASILIALIMAVAATVLGYETRSLLVGESASKSTLKRIGEMVQADPAVEQARRPLTMYLGPETVLLALDVRCDYQTLAVNGG
jgi:divalent metal cation (Fe/Co/Zn/Cd) transporter